MATRFKQILIAVGSQLDEAQTAIGSLRACLIISVASGVQLDFIGSIQGVNRNGDTDAYYRVRIENAIKYNFSCGEMSPIILCLQDNMTNFDCTINGSEDVSSVVFPNFIQPFREVGYATLEVHVQAIENDPLTNKSVLLPYDRYYRVKRVVAAGVRFLVRVRFIDSDLGKEFSFQDDTDAFNTSNVFLNPAVVDNHGFCEWNSVGGVPISNSRYVEAYQ